MVHVQYISLIQSTSSSRFSPVAPHRSSCIQRNRPHSWWDHGWTGFYHRPPENGDIVRDSCAHLLSYLTKQFDMFGILSTMPPSQCAAMHCKPPIRSRDYTNRLQLLNWWDLRGRINSNVFSLVLATLKFKWRSNSNVWNLPSSIVILQTFT